MGEIFLIRESMRKYFHYTAHLNPVDKLEDFELIPDLEGYDYKIEFTVEIAVNDVDEKVRLDDIIKSKNNKNNRID